MIHFLGETQSQQVCFHWLPSFLWSLSETAIPSQSILSKARTQLDLAIGLSDFTPLAFTAECKFPPFSSLKRKELFFELQRKRHHKHFCLIMDSYREFLACWAKYNSWSFFPSLFNSEVRQERKTSAWSWCYSGWQHLIWCYYSGSFLLIAVYCPKDIGQLNSRAEARPF